jgi:hypothetical protein
LIDKITKRTEEQKKTTESDQPDISSLATDNTPTPTTPVTLNAAPPLPCFEPDVRQTAVDHCQRFW